MSSLRYLKHELIANGINKPSVEYRRGSVSSGLTEPSNGPIVFASNPSTIKKAILRLTTKSISLTEIRGSERLINSNEINPGNTSSKPKHKTLTTGEPVPKRTRPLNSTAKHVIAKDSLFRLKWIFMLAPNMLLGTVV